MTDFPPFENYDTHANTCKLNFTCGYALNAFRILHTTRAVVASLSCDDRSNWSRRSSITQTTFPPYYVMLHLVSRFPNEINSRAGQWIDVCQVFSPGLYVPGMSAGHADQFTFTND